MACGLRKSGVVVMVGRERTGGSGRALAEWGGVGASKVVIVAGGVAVAF